ncbi:MAG TPA: cytochrome c peroxidase [Kofleriaceae bacterium]|nr:cytochrome c peroxidase [Kofleriaceae bacterium]
MKTLFLAVLLLAGCPHRGDNKPTPATKDDAAVASDAAAVVLAPAPPVPEVPNGLPPLGERPQITAVAVAFGDALFDEPRLSSTGAIKCATCHDRAHGFSGTPHQLTATGKPNLRRAPSLVDLAWQTDFGWDGRYTSLSEQLAAHIKGQMGDDVQTAMARLADVPTVRAHLARVEGPSSPADAAIAALAAFVLTRYDGDSPWDRAERSGDAPAELSSGYQLFTGKAQCSVCHTPPLYTDLRYHRIGLVASKDEGRGKTDPAQAGAFRTPTLRGAANRTALFHDGSATSLDAAIDWHLAGGLGQGADSSIIDPALKVITLSAAERAKLGAFVRALSQ